MKLTYMLLMAFLPLFATAQDAYIYEPSAKYPFGRLNPEAPPQTADYAPMIGECRCKSVTRNTDGTWQKDTVAMIWRFKYFMNGMAVQDETLKADGKHSSSIRQYQADSARWFVTYFSSTAVSPSPGVWRGGKEGENIVLYRPQQSPNGMEGFSGLHLKTSLTRALTGVASG